MIYTVEQVNDEAKQVKGRTNWGIKAGGKWIKLYIDFKPAVGQTFDLNVTDSTFKGKTYYWGEIIGPAPLQTTQQAQPMQVHQPRAPAPTAQPGAPNGKIKWEDWDQMARVARDLGSLMDLEGDARAAFINTTMIAFSNGKLELPTEAGPVSREPGDDSDPYDRQAYLDPNKTVTPWGS